MKILVKRAGKEPEIKETGERYRTRACRPIIFEEESGGNIVQFISLNKERTLWIGIDEDGIMKQLPINFFIGTVPTKESSMADSIVGTAVFFRTAYIAPERFFLEEIQDYEIEDLTDEDISFIITEILSDESQAYLKRLHAEHPVKPFDYISW